MNEIKKNKSRFDSPANQVIRAGLIDRMVGRIILSRAYSRVFFRPLKLARII